MIEPVPRAFKGEIYFAHLAQLAQPATDNQRVVVSALNTAAFLLVPRLQKAWLVKFSSAVAATANLAAVDRKR